MTWMRVPNLVWIAEPCPVCGATTTAEARQRCRPGRLGDLENICPAGMSRDGDRLLRPTRESAERVRAFVEDILKTA